MCPRFHVLYTVLCVPDEVAEKQQGESDDQPVGILPVCSEEVKVAIEASPLSISHEHPDSPLAINLLTFFVHD